MITDFVKCSYCLALLLLVAACERLPEEQVFGGPIMGTTYSVKYIGGNPATGKLEADVAAELARINSIMSTYDPESELSRFNRGPVGQAIEVSKELREVIELAEEIYGASDEALDVTVGPLVNLWGFGADPRQSEVPPPDAIAQAKSRTGFGALGLQGSKLTRHRDIYVDLSAIAKGYAVDQVSQLLESRGIQRYLVEVGGELRGHGLNAAGEPWRIAVEQPEALARSIFTTLPLRDLGMATSGDYRNYFEVDGQRYSHMIDPRTGYPVTHTTVSVTVLARTCAEADGYATAINVMGVEAGLALAEARNLAILVIMKTDGRFVSRTSSAMQTYLGES